MQNFGRNMVGLKPCNYAWTVLPKVLQKLACRNSSSISVEFCMCSFGKTSAEVCLQDFSRSLCIIMMQNFIQKFNKTQHAETPQHYLHNSACINSNAIFVGPSIQESRGNLCRIVSGNSTELTFWWLLSRTPHAFQNIFLQNSAEF